MAVELRGKGGRPPKPAPEKRSEEVKFHVTPTVKHRLQEEAKAAGIDLATYCREKVLTGQPPRRIPPEMLALVAELMREQNNLNQLARIANGDGNLHRIASRLEGLLGFYDDLAQRIKGCFYDRQNSNR